MRETPEEILGQIDTTRKLKEFLESEVRRYDRIIINLEHKLKLMGYKCDS